MQYDKTNIFAKILRGEIPTNKLYEDAFCVAIPDIAPAAPVHILVLPKGEFVSFDDFIDKADAKFVAGFFKSVQKIARDAGLKENGYRIIYNHGKDASQTVFHFHAHILGGTQLGGLIPADSRAR